MLEPYWNMQWMKVNVFLKQERIYFLFMYYIDDLKKFNNYSNFLTKIVLKSSVASSSDLM